MLHLKICTALTVSTLGGDNALAVTPIRTIEVKF
jgi:hypothetical protein